MLTFKKYKIKASIYATESSVAVWMAEGSWLFDLPVDYLVQLTTGQTIEDKWSFRVNI